MRRRSALDWNAIEGGGGGGAEKGGQEEKEKEENTHEIQLCSYHFNESVSTYTDYNSKTGQPNVKNHQIHRFRVVIIIVNIFNATSRIVYKVMQGLKSHIKNVHL